MRGISRVVGVGLLVASCSSGASNAPRERSSPPTETFIASTNERGAPTFLWASATRSSEARSRTPEIAARAHLEDTASRYGLSREALATAEVVHVDREANLVVFRQRLDGVDVMESDAKVLMNANLDLVAIGGGLHPAGSAKHGKFVRKAPPKARPVYFPIRGRLVPAYVVETRESATSAHELVVAADDGRVLRRTSLAKTATYRVFADADGRPADGPLVDTTPYPSATIDETLAPGYATSRLVTIDGFNAKKDPWLPASASETKGNNVDAFTDDGDPEGFTAGDLRASMTSANTFDRSYDFAAEPDANDTQRMAAVTEAFFVTNWLHDYWYDSGFDETSGNPQADNFGRGGKAGDPLLVKVQFGIGRGKVDNAQALPMSDGESPSLQFYLFRQATGGTVHRDSALENTVVAHEWGHVLHRRLVAGDNAQTAAMSEGWADFVALHMMLRPGDDLAGTYAVGGSLATSRSGSSVYWGLRRVPYSTDFAKNDLSLRHVGGGQPGVPYDTTNNAPSFEEHNAGEVWATAVFEAYIALQKRGATGAYSFAEAQRRMASYVVAGMKLAPVAPTFTEQRDALIAAALAKDASDAAAFTKAFAVRGLGSCAIAPERNSQVLDGIVESFDVRPAASIGAITFEPTITSCDGDAYLDAGETGRATVHVSNTSNLPLDGARLTASSTLKGVSFPKGASVSVPALAPFASVEVTVEVSLEAGTNDPRLLDLAFALEATGACATPGATISFPANVDEKAASSDRERVSTLSTPWTTKDNLDDAVAAKIWRRRETNPGDRVWHADNFGSRSDTALESPSIVVSKAQPFSISFAHRYQFEYDAVHDVRWDGGLVEITADNGVTWSDASTLAVPSYDGLLGHSEATNPLSGRRGYGGTSLAWPASTVEFLDFGTKLAGKTVKIRFRVGTDSFSSAYGWDIDDITLAGANTPFSSLVADESTCTTAPREPDAGSRSENGAKPSPIPGTDAGTNAPAAVVTEEDEGCGVAGASPSRAWWLVGLALLVVRRRRSNARRR